MSEELRRCAKWKAYIATDNLDFVEDIDDYVFYETKKEAVSTYINYHDKEPVYVVQIEITEVTKYKN